MSKVKTTENTQKAIVPAVIQSTAETTMKFVNKLIINGEAVEPAPKKVEITINSKKLNLNCRIIPDDCIAAAYTNSFVIPVKEKDIQVFYSKGGGVLSASLYVDSMLEYSCISMQGIFAIIQANFGVDKLTTDRLYIASNANRKKTPEPKKSEVTIVTEATKAAVQ